MAFMMPVVKNDWDIYRSQRTNNNMRRTSDNSRSRKASECRSSECPSLSTSPGSTDFFSPAHRSAPMAVRTSNSSRASLQSPSKGSSTASSSPPKSSGSQSSLNKFHTRLVDKLKRSFRSSSSEADSRSSS
ncbi:uncharacterized protein LOC132199256 [Neocloeon triangulifer]|uniref:uncharacterized protein LOC132199256 n=1 Tax=Neocloeon triangulifer TaxID=2078957 RepID=UPI00286F1175|nr:uncharacterized protein LOC132199256 [Neocloeon triangulifer]